MRDSYWKTTRQVSRRSPVQWPSLRQGLGQVGWAAAILVIWGVVFAAFLWLNGLADETTVASQPDLPVAAPVSSTTPTQTPNPTPTATQSPTVTPVPLSTDTGEQQQEAGLSPAPTPTSTPSPTPTLTPTQTPSPALPEETGGVSFSADVLPIFESRCIKCHGGEKTEEGLRLTSHTEVLAGSWNGPVVEPGNVADSFLIEQVESGEMPKNEPRLLPAEIRTLTEWVVAGAPDN